MTPTPYPIAFVGWLASIIAVIWGTGWIATRVVRWFVARRQRRERELREAFERGDRVFRNDREAAAWLIEDSAKGSKV